MEFTYNAYRTLIEKICAAGYEICDYHNYGMAVNPCILRHDVDFDLKKAVKMATLENEIGVKSTFFVLVNTNFYNVFSTDNRKHMESILMCGHEIGLHFDEMQYELEGNQGKIVAKIQEESEVLSKILGKEVTVVSMHRPSQGLLEANIEIPGMVNSYAHRFFREIKYFSDSRMNWRENVIAGVNIENNQGLHILTHPFWYGKEEKTLRENLLEFISGAGVERYDFLNLNFRNLAEEIVREDVERRTAF